MDRQSGGVQMQIQIKQRFLQGQIPASFFHGVAGFADFVENAVRSDGFASGEDAAELSGKGLSDGTVSDAQFQNGHGLSLGAGGGLDADVVPQMNPGDQFGFESVAEDSFDATAELSDSSGNIRPDQMVHGASGEESQRAFAGTGGVEKRKRGRRIVRIQRLAVGRNHIGHIIRLSHPPFDFQGGDAEFAEFRNQFDGGKIPAGKIERLFSAVGPEESPAGLFASAAVAARPAEPGGEETGAGKTDTERPMHKNLQFQRGAFRKEFQLLQRDLPFENDAPDSHAFRRPDRQRVMKRHLGGAVNDEFRKKFPNHADDSDILHDYGVGTQLREKRQFIRGFVEFGFPEKRVECDVDFFLPAVSFRQKFGHLLRREIVAAFPGVEFFQSAVDGIRSRIERGHGDRQTAGRSKKFNGTGGILHECWSLPVISGILVS